MFDHAHRPQTAVASPSREGWTRFKYSRDSIFLGSARACVGCSGAAAALRSKQIVQQCKRTNNPLNGLTW